MKQTIFICFPLVLLLAVNGTSQEVLRVQNGALLTVGNGAGLTISGGLMLEKGSQLTNHGTITLVKSKTGSSFWRDSTAAPYSYGDGIVLSSGGGQSLETVNTFHRLEINADSIRLGTDISADQWYLTRGRISTGAFKAIVMSTADTAVQADNSNPHFANSWFDGVLRRSFDGHAAQTFFFPVGDEQKANPAVMENLQTAPLNNISYIDASFGPKRGTDAGLVLKENGTPFTMVNDAGVWYMTPDNEPTQGSYDLLLYLGGFGGLQDNSFAILRRPDSSTAASDWEVPANSLLPSGNDAGRTVAEGFARRNNIGSFSQYGIGMTSTPLPITLLDFSVHRTDPTTVMLQWSTGTESNNKGFDVEKRLDKEASFLLAGFVPSATAGGNSNNILHYTYTDANDYYGVTYYRLKQTDLDGHYTYTLIKAVSGGGAGAAVLLYPNPSQGQFTIRMDGAPGSHEVRIVDGKGAVVKVMLLYGNTPLPVTGLRSGAYIVQIPDAFGPGRPFSQKILVVK